MQIATILAALEDYLRPIVEADAGVLSVSETETDALEMLAGNAPDKWRVVLSCDGETAPEEFGRAGHVLGRVLVYLQQPKGLENPQRKSLHRARTGKQTPFLARLHWLIRKLRAVQFDHDEIDAQQALNYRGWEWIKVDGFAAFRAARAQFEILFVHDDPASELPTPDPVLTPSTPTLAIVGAYLHITLGGATKRVRVMDL